MAQIESQLNAADDGAKDDPNREIVYFEGSRVIRGELGMMATWTFIALVLLALPVLAWYFQWQWWRWYSTLGVIFVAAMCVVVPILAIKAVRYRITNYRIDYERGLLSKHVDTLELWHVDDISFRQSLLERLLRVGTITILSGDKSTPKLVMDGIPDSRPVFDSLKDRIIAVKRQRGVIKMDMGGGGLGA